MWSHLLALLLHGRVRFVIALTSNDGALRFRLLKAVQSEL
jgi:D-alanyl-D-alanine carboxypeptidase/D-alanyl-D-alanine-endopeptidase (penicillin-binding protein 4)